MVRNSGWVFVFSLLNIDEEWDLGNYNKIKHKKETIQTNSFKTTEPEDGAKTM